MSNNTKAFLLMSPLLGIILFILANTPPMVFLLLGGFIGMIFIFVMAAHGLDMLE
jgi:hypothetical protein